MKLSCIIGVGMAGCCLLAAISSAIAPPRQGELDRYREDGTLAQRIEFGEIFKNDKFYPGLIERAGARLRQLELFREGSSAEDISRIAPLPPPSWKGMPTTGNNRMLTLLIEFEDEKHKEVNSQQSVHSSIYGSGLASQFPYESLAAYYRRASYGKLNISGDTLGWYTAPYKRSQVPKTPEGREKLIEEALRFYEKSGHDFSQYDNDRDGDIDCISVIYAGPDTGWNSFWWAYQTNFTDLKFTVGGKRLSTYIFQFQNYNEAPDEFSPNIIIHEVGHALGLPDYYDYYPDKGPGGGLGGLDMMDANCGDQNCFSKWLLEWITPKVIGSGSTTVELRPSGVTEDALLIMPNAVSNPFREYFMVQNRMPAGNDSGADWPGKGLLIWHIDARLNAAGSDYRYDNQKTPHKLIRVMEADGKEEIEAGKNFKDPGDFFVPGMSFGTETKPASLTYQGKPSGVFVRNISMTEKGISADVGIDSASPVPVEVPREAFLKLSVLDQ